MLSPQSLFDLSAFGHAAVFAEHQLVWNVLATIGDYIRETFSHGLKPMLYADIGANTVIEGDVYIGAGTVVEPGAFIRGPAIIGENCQIRQGAYIRGNLITGDHCVIGHATEVKNSLFLNHAQAAHFAYVGDSILGNRVNLGAGTRLANLRLPRAQNQTRPKPTHIRFFFSDQEYDTGLRKFGAILGDDVQTGCNVVTNPGCIVGPRTLIYPLTSVRGGYYPPDTTVKTRGNFLSM